MPDLQGWLCATLTHGMHACKADLVEAHVPIEVLPCHRPRTGLEQEDDPEAHVLHNDIKGKCCMTMQHLKLKT